MALRLLSTYPFPPTLRDALIKAGFQTQKDVLDLGPAALAKELSLAHTDAVKIQKIIENGSDISLKPDNADNGRSALELYRRQHKIKPVYTLCEKLDKMLGGGVIAPQLTEFCGVPGIGKTQLAIQIACDVSIPAAFHGVEGSAVYIDTEGSFVPERAAEIAQGLVDHLHAVASEDTKAAAAAVTMESILNNIHCYRVYDATEQLAVVRNLPKFIDQHKNVRVVIIDSVAFHFRRGFDDMAMRSRMLTSMAQQLADAAERYSLAVVLVNQVTSKGTDTSSGGEMHAPALGETWAHQCTNRVMLQWVNRTERWARLLKSPSQKPTSIQYQIRPCGIRDVDYLAPSPVMPIVAAPAAAVDAKAPRATTAAANGPATAAVAPLAFVPPPAINRAISRTQSQAQAIATGSARQPAVVATANATAPAAAPAPSTGPVVHHSAGKRSFQFLPSTAAPAAAPAAASAPAPASVGAAGRAASSIAAYPAPHGGSAFSAVPQRSVSTAAAAPVRGQFGGGQFGSGGGGQFGTPAPAAAAAAGTASVAGPTALSGAKRKSTAQPQPEVDGGW